MQRNVAVREPGPGGVKSDPSGIGPNGDRFGPSGDRPQRRFAQRRRTARGTSPPPTATGSAPHPASARLRRRRRPHRARGSQHPASDRTRRRRRQHQPSEAAPVRLQRHQRAHGPPQHPASARLRRRRRHQRAQGPLHQVQRRSAPSGVGSQTTTTPAAIGPSDTNGRKALSIGPSGGPGDDHPANKLIVRTQKRLEAEEVPSQLKSA